MDIFRFRDAVISDYAKYLESFINIRDPEIREVVEESFRRGDPFPPALLQLNPFFSEGGTIAGLVAEGVLHPECARIFCRKNHPEDPGRPLTLYQHQVQGIHCARAEKNFVLTTGTGSGKSLAYLIPIVDHILKVGSGRGIQAICVYPMNALVNSQEEELKKFIRWGYPEGRAPVTFRRYTGQESREERDEIVARPPDIILTNYVMLELILTRVYERSLVRSARGMRFLVLDELHTYRGRQGADVALLVRRLRDAVAAPRLQVIGTSATLAGSGPLAGQRAEVAELTTRFFGSPVEPDSVIGETLERITPDRPPEREELIRSIRSPADRPARGYREFINDPLVIWLENAIGLQRDQGSRQWVRARPQPVEGRDAPVEKLAALTGLPPEDCRRAIKSTLLEGVGVLDPRERSLFAFRFHQFLSRGDSVFASLDRGEDRYLTVSSQKYVPGDRNRRLFPLSFCRECGDAYYSVNRCEIDGRAFYEPREFNRRAEGENVEAGYLYPDFDKKWPEADPEKIIEILPETMLEDQGGRIRIRTSARNKIPRVVYLSQLAREGEGPLRYLWFPTPFIFCHHCGVTYHHRQVSDFGKLTTLGPRGRATATTILARTVVSRLRDDDRLPPTARKLLSFTDNRQDASLQAGHFNDFI